MAQSKQPLRKEPGATSIEWNGRPTAAQDSGVRARGFRFTRRPAQDDVALATGLARRGGLLQAGLVPRQRP
jgi:hypothetical protein